MIPMAGSSLFELMTRELETFNCCVRVRDSGSNGPTIYLPKSSGCDNTLAKPASRAAVVEWKVLILFSCLHLSLSLLFDQLIAPSRIHTPSHLKKGERGR